MARQLTQAEKDAWPPEWCRLPDLETLEQLSRGETVEPPAVEADLPLVQGELFSAVPQPDPSGVSVTPEV